ncbi:MAG: PspC domain-containing protein [Candidatus Zixiibacteriota bacterium]
MAGKLYRSNTNKIIGGVCGGLGEYFDVDPVLVRVIAVILLVATWFYYGLLAYVVAWILIPKRPPEVEPVPANHQYSSWTRYLPGLILIFIGAVLLVREHWFWFEWAAFWPVLLIGLGLLLILRRNHKGREQDAAHVGHQHGNTHNGGTIA